MMEEPAQTDWKAIAVRLGVFVVLAVLGMELLPWMMQPISGYLVAGALGTFAAAAIANAITLRIFERGRLADIGLGWTVASRRHLVIGLAGGAISATAVSLIPLAVGASRIVRTPENPLNLPSLLFVSVVLAFGAVGEEMLFRGYAFQVLAGAAGPFASILPFAVLFAAAHVGNPAVTIFGIITTVVWGVLLGYAFVKAGDLWLPIGLHLGWNWIMPLFGTNLSGFTMGLTGYEMRPTGSVLWNGGSYGPEGGLPACLVVIALFYYLQRMPIEEQPAFLLRRES